jgi:hypothetical protein
VQAPPSIWTKRAGSSARSRQFETALARFDPDQRNIGCGAAIRYAADFLSKAYAGERADPRSPEQIARSMMRHAMRESLGLNPRTNVVSFRPGHESASRARRTKRPGSPTPFSWRTLKRREWLHANHYIRRFVTVVEPVVDSVVAGIKENGIDCLILNRRLVPHGRRERQYEASTSPGTVLSHRKRNQCVC